MKAYKYERSSAGYHWSADMHENIIYIPEFDALLYSSGSNRKGISFVEEIKQEGKDYIDDMKNGKLYKISTSDNKIKVPESPYSNATFMLSTDIHERRGDKYVKKIPSYTVGNSTYQEVNLYNFQEIDINVTKEEIDKLIELTKQIKDLKSEHDSLIEKII